MNSTDTLPITRPSLVVPRFAELPEDIQAVIEALSAPFPIAEVKVRPGPVTRDGTAAIAFPYCDWWTGYLPRLNDLVGPNNWTITLHPWGEHQVIARLNAFGGLIISESTGNAKGDTNGAQEAEVQAKKRTCAEGLMLGLYFYFLPNVWGKGERAGKDFSFAEGEEQRCVWEMYRRAGLLPMRSTGATLNRPVASAPNSAHPATPPTPATSPPAVAPASERAARARAALAQVEQRVGLAPRTEPATAPRADTTTPAPAPPTTPNPPLASDAQLGLIARLLIALRSGATEATIQATDAAINAAGATFGITNLAMLLSKDALRCAVPQLTKLQAIRLIDQLKAQAARNLAA